MDARTFFGTEKLFHERMRQAAETMARLHISKSLPNFSIQSHSLSSSRMHVSGQLFPLYQFSYTNKELGTKNFVSFRFTERQHIELMHCFAYLAYRIAERKSPNVLLHKLLNRYQLMLRYNTVMNYMTPAILQRDHQLLEEYVSIALGFETKSIQSIVPFTNPL